MSLRLTFSCHYHMSYAWRLTTTDHSRIVAAISQALNHSKTYAGQGGVWTVTTTTRNEMIEVTFDCPQPSGNQTLEVMQRYWDAVNADQKAIDSRFDATFRSLKLLSRYRYSDEKS